MKGILKFSDFIRENKLNEANKSSDLFTAVYDKLKKLNKSSISVPPSYQSHDKDMYFDFVANGVEYRVSYNSVDEMVYLINMDDGAEVVLTTADDIIGKIQ